MLCQFCQQNEADRSFSFQMMGMDQEIHLCDDCLEKFRQYADTVGQQFMSNPQAFAAFFPQRDQAREMQPTAPRKKPEVAAPKPERPAVDNPFPEDAGEAIRNRRLLNALRARLREAIASERYEDAIRVQGDIERIEGGERE